MTTPDLDELLRQATDMQHQIEAMRDRMTGMEIIGAARGGAVAVALTVGGEFQRVRVDPEIHAEGPSAVEEALLAALRDAGAQLREHTTRQIENLQDFIGDSLRH